MVKRLILSFALLMVLQPAAAIDLANYELVDLTHPYNESTIYWPTSPSRFELNNLSYGETSGGWFYSANRICTPEHGGTHFDAPVHFAAAGLPVQDVPLHQLMAPGIVLDISAQAARDPNYRLSLADLEAFEKQHGKIQAGTIVILRTGWSERWPDTKAYLGDDTPGDVSQLSFPSYGAKAARMLVEERGVALLGVDTASIDFGQSTDFPVHRLAAAQNVGGLENLTGLGGLPATGFTVIALPMKIEGGSGGPVRAVAVVPR